MTVPTTGPVRRTIVLAIHREDIEQLIPIDELACFVDHDDAVAIAVERHTDIAFHGRHGQLQELRLRRTAASVNVLAIWRAADRDNLGTQIGQCSRSNLVSGTVRAIENHLHTLKVDPIGHAGRTEILVANARRVDTLGLAELTATPA